MISASALTVIQIARSNPPKRTAAITTINPVSAAPTCLSQRRSASHAALFRHDLGSININCIAGSLLFGYHGFQLGDHYTEFGTDLAEWNPALFRQLVRNEMTPKGSVCRRN